MTRNRRRALTIEDARTLTDTWHAMGESHREAQQLASRFSDAGPHRVIEMWETGRVIEDPRTPRSRNGQRLSKFEVQALAERWAELFGCVPPDLSNGTPSAQPAAPSPATPPVPADDTMLPFRDVIRRTGLSKSTIKRMVANGKFPRWTKLSVRRVGWKVSAGKAWLAERDAASIYMSSRGADRRRLH
jgi:prophage regulatory protein